MRKIICIIMFLSLPFIGFSLTIKDIVIQGVSDTDPKTILFYFFEYDPKKEYSTTELTQALFNWNRRLERTGWFQNIRISHEIISDTETVLFVNLTERSFYTAKLYNSAIGFGKQNLWGKGKEIFFDVGPIQKRISLTDHMYQFSPFFYQILLGTSEKTLVEYPRDFYQNFPILSQESEVIAGWRLFPDHTISLRGNGQIILQTNQMPLERFVSLSVVYSIDTQRGFPAFSSGYFVNSSLTGYIAPLALSWETTFLWHHPFSPAWQLSFKWHHGFSLGTLPSSGRFLLRQINGLHTLSQNPGLLGNNCWDAHAELRWKFWDVIPFLIFDIQLEAVGFIESGEAWNNWENIGRHTFVVYGGGLRIYVDRFAIRTEMGIDNFQQTAILSSFELPF